MLVSYHRIFIYRHFWTCPSPPRYALFLRRATPTRSNFSRPDAAFVGVPISATPYSSVGPRQRGPTFPGQTSPLFAPPYPLRLISPSGHANTDPLFPGGRRLCWRRPTRCALFLRLATPTRPEISRPDAAFVGAALPAAPYFFASPRQHRPEISWHVGVLGCSEIKKNIPASNAGFLTTGQSPCSSRYAYNA